ncbi:hypothetical protein [Micromonospora sp. NBC_01813]|uniref:hypothetical protein n=1 Tax=Micromonospora sp. NBC_01813 TaxID=2975988 RepID=UPI002DD9FE3D|nr:hypothetical protein [Micromonospora sp. NBC_01813]WSA08530.1 hypothetical protein OG958_30845 [Micromonospora sp. NBC_01813]
MPAAPELALTTDLTDAYPEWLEVRDALRSGDWPTAHKLITAQPPSVQTQLTAQAGAEPEIRPLVQQQVEADPADSVAAALLGRLMIHEAWQVRTSARAKDVSRSQFRTFHELLRAAERMLIDAAAYQPDDCSIWACRLITARGLELGQSEARRRYDRLAEQDPHHLPGQELLLQQLCPKWGGTFDEMHGFAREVAAAAPTGALNGSLVAQAHFEHMCDLKSWELAKYATDEVKEEVRMAAARSVLHPDFRPTYGWIDAASRFALVLGMLDDHAAAAPHFKALGNRVSSNVWGNFDDSIAMFADLRRRALAAGGAR